MDNQLGNTPILLIIFNRPRTIKPLFNSIRTYHPKQIFIFADGPRKNNNNDIKLCSSSREQVINEIDWPCDVHTKFLDSNIGCGYGPSSAISWFFSNVDKGIILEDDCICHSDFYHFAEVLLSKYENDSSVFAINASHDIDYSYGEGSYYFSMQQGPFHGWATWKRAWDIFDFYLKNFSSLSLCQALRHYKVTKYEKTYWQGVLSDIKKDVYLKSTWDYQFSMCIWRQHGKTIMPNVNMTCNIGYGADATHPFSEESHDARLPTFSIMPIIHPECLKINRDADYEYFVSHLFPFVDTTPFLIKLKRKIKKTYAYFYHLRGQKI